MAQFPTSDLALRFDPTGFACDLAIEDGDLALDATPVTAMLVSLGTDRRAASDDVLPDGVSPLTAPSRWDRRRGWVGDCLEATGRRIGSRLWLLSREHETDETRVRASGYVDEALAWANRDLGLTPEIEVTWVRRGLLKIRAHVDGRSVTLQRRVA